jgi:hypothetical protein
MTDQQERALIDGLRALAATTRCASASPAVEAAVLAEMARRPAPVRRTSPAWLPIAAALLLAVAGGIWVSEQAERRSAGSIVPAGFVSLPGAASLPPFESGAIVRIALPVSALPSYGIQIVPDFESERIDVDLLVAQDGIPRAIRFADDTHASRSTP